MHGSESYDPSRNAGQLSGSLTRFEGKLAIHVSLIFMQQGR